LRRRGSHTFAGFECVGGHGSIGGDLAETGHTQFTPTHSNVRNEWGTRRAIMNWLREYRGNTGVRTRDSIKAEHERAIADQLLAALEVEATFVRLGDPNKSEPDVIYSRPSEQIIGIEVVTAYYEDSDAKDAAEIAAGEKPLGPGEMRERSAGLLVEPDQKICERIQTELEKKCRKSYANADENWLCINQDALLSDAKTVDECVKNLKVPAGHGFDRIYLTYTAPVDEGGKYTPVRLL